jgi:iron complex transport system substrate-binding protein
MREHEAPIELTDDAGHVVRLDAPARRVVSLIPGRTDAILALGAADRLVARTRFDTDPRLAGLPSMENALTPSVEWLVAQQPDLIVAWPDEQARSVVSRLIEIGIPVYSSRVQTIADVERAVSDLGTLLGLDAAADSVLAAMQSELAAVRAAVASSERKTVLYLVGIEPAMAAGPETFIDEIITIAGGTNLFGDAGAMWPMISVEEVVRRSPDIIVVSVGELASADVLERMRVLPGWRSLSAVRESRVHTVPADSFNRPGPAVARSARRLGALFHPQAFPRDGAGKP